MLDYYLQPLLEGFIFVIGIYLEKYIRSNRLLNIRENISQKNIPQP